MAASIPPDSNKQAATTGKNTSGKVADFRYRASPQPHYDGPTALSGGEKRSRAAGARTNQNGISDSKPNRVAANDSEHVAADKAASLAMASRSERPARDDMLDQAHRSAEAAKQDQPGGARSGPLRGKTGRQTYAALDLGTNNCRLLIARPVGDGFTVIDAFSRVVRLGEGLAHTGRLSDAAMERTIAALKICASKLVRRHVRLARSVATEACRRAENGEEFIARVRRETGIVFDIISAEEEARLAVLGCHILIEQGSGPALIFDIGGGSTELVLIEPGGPVPKIIDWQSVPWGVVSLSDVVGPGGLGDPVKRAERYATMRRNVDESFAGFADRIRQYAGLDDIRLLGTSGTVTTLASLHLGLPHYDRRAVDGLIVPSTAMRDVAKRLSVLSVSERAALPCVGEDRAELVVAGCAILESILDIWPAERLGVADRGIREGILRSLMATDGRLGSSVTQTSNAHGSV